MFREQSWILVLAFGLTYSIGGWAKEWVDLPKDLRWCAATAAHQIEGNNVHSDWWAWENQPGRIAHGERSGNACDHWNRVQEDVDLMSGIGINTYRFSIEWAKVEPEQGFYDVAVIEHYKDEVERLKRAGVSPFITLHHFTFPQWLREKGGWEWEEAPKAFADFAETVYQQIAPGEKDWVTINEPMVHVMGGYYEGLTPPGEKRSLKKIMPVFRGLLRAHGQAYHRLHALARLRHSPIRVGLAHHLRKFSPRSKYNPLDLLAVAMVQQAWNWTLVDAVETGKLKLILPPMVHSSENLPEIAGTEDFLGVNYYTGNQIRFSMTQGFKIVPQTQYPKNDLGWDIDPEGFFQIISDTSARYPGKPILITENGIADSKDQLRPQFLKDHLYQLSRAIQTGIPVEMYCYWSLMDNFEWVEGFGPRFGLFEMDYSTLRRIPRGSAALLQKIIANHGFDLTSG